MDNSLTLTWSRIVSNLPYKRKLFTYLLIYLGVFFVNQSIAATVIINAEDEPTELNKGYSTMNLGSQAGSFSVSTGTALIGTGTSVGVGLGPMEYSSDGKYYGYKIGPDVYVLLAGITTYYTTVGSLTMAFEPEQSYWVDDDGNNVLSLTGNSAAAHSTASLTTSPNSNGNLGMQDVDIYVYAGPNAVSGDYTIPTLYTWSNYKKGPSIDGTFFNSTSVTVKSNKLDCSILAPSTIDFGIINLTGAELDGDILSYHNGDLLIECSGSSVDATASATIAITGAKGRYSDTLALVGNSGAAEIRGVIGEPITPAGSCDAKNQGYQNVIQFSSALPIDVGKITVGSNKIPYSMSLCSKGVKNLGGGTATATIDISWN